LARKIALDGLGRGDLLTQLQPYPLSLCRNTQRTVLQRSGGRHLDCKGNKQNTKQAGQKLKLNLPLPMLTETVNNDHIQLYTCIPYRYAGNRDSGQQRTSKGDEMRDLGRSRLVGHKTLKYDQQI